MSRCQCCKLEMLNSDGCAIDEVEIKGKPYRRIKVGDKFDFYYGYENKNLRCHDCNAKFGNYHHYGCDAEVCPKCHEQLIGCSCEDMYFGEFNNQKDSEQFLNLLKQLEKIDKQRTNM